VKEDIHHQELPNGLVLLGETMPGVQSVAMTVAVPAGASHDPPGAEGAAAVAGEWLFRGAGERDTRALNDALDALGCRHDEDADSAHLKLSAAQLGRNFADVLAIYADVLRRPRLEKETFEPCRELTEQDLASLEDEPGRRCHILLRERFYPFPLGRCRLGTPASLQAMTADALRQHLHRTIGPAGTILAVAGNVQWDALREQVQRLLGDWPAQQAANVATSPPLRGTMHVKKDSAQAHIALAHEAVPLASEDYYACRLAQMVLSGGMGARLFVEVREKRGLVYHVSCRYDGLKDHAGLFTYAGTTPAHAAETLRVTVGELRRLVEGIEDDEMARAKTKLKSALILQSESTTARAAHLAADWHHLGRVRPLDEIAAAVDATTKEAVLDYCRRHPAAGFTVLSIGPEPLDTSDLPVAEA